MTCVVVCSGGPKRELCSFDDFKARNALFIGADKGALYLIEEGIVPTDIVGDFDSLSKEEWQRVSTIALNAEKVQAEKDETDTDLALLKALTYNPTEIFLTGVTGGRLDHFEAALRSMYRLQKEHPQIHIKIINSHNEIRILFPGEHTIIRDEKFRYISFFAYEDEVENVTIRGLKYETTKECIEIGTSRFTSNELISSLGYISFSSGICLMIRSSD
ncbi:thiamine diphosphokinase [Ureibacillus chungkukjangi]|uniref:Thiamine diphosphokinase n=1 Tax=Ureibacillus chungkukjangi TaxID=1202712 RepID=A0A318TQH5_9BACL|nr:thiamine diphosphokinase [Ureibacillus chungkukjangi]MCM3386707.1 thiamine diphosphokinase [Ureibacillus chungkukjangi]PYF07062.1 thiamine diphosphokinase [Ureibacillus chungkukjangi]